MRASFIYIVIGSFALGVFAARKHRVLGLPGRRRKCASLIAPTGYGLTAPHDAIEWSSKSDRAGASGAFLNWVRLSAMTLVDFNAPLVKLEYWTISC